MSNGVEPRNQRSVFGRENGSETPRRSSAVSGPVESHDHDHSNDHFALLYESREDQFASAIPFIRQGLERGEHCLYVADDNSREDVVAAMRAHGIAVDAALESGALAVLTPAETYRRTGEFDRARMLKFWKESLERAKDEDGHTGLRAAAEMTWALDGDTSADELVEYEAMLNSLYQDEDYAVMCQYNRERFPAAVIHDVIETHPHIISDGTVSQNFYYTPPEKFFSSEEMKTKVDRMMRTLQERTEVKMELKERQEHLERVFESSHDAILIVDPEAEAVVDANPAAADMLGYTRDELLTLGPSDVHPNELDTFREFVDEVIEDGTGWMDELTYHTNDRGRIPAEISASRMEYNGRPVMLAVVRDISERRKWERAQRRLYEITADPDRTFDEKLQAAFELGCEQFDLDLGGIARVDPETDLFAVETISGEHDHLEPDAQVDLSETYCRIHDDTGEAAGVTDPAEEGFDGTIAYEEFGVRSYLGTRITLDDDLDRTFFFVAAEQRSTEFSEAERTFLDLMGQWVKYELERRQRERKLRESTEYLRALVETTPECIKTVAADGTLLQMNAAGLDMGQADSASDVIGECVYDLVAPEHRERYREFNERICRGERGTLEFEIIGLEGTRRHLETHAAPLDRPDGTTVQVAVTRDITDQVKRERELERALDLLERTERIADVGGWEIDPDTMDVFWTDQIFELLEVDADEEPPLEEALGMYHEADQPIVEGAVEEALDSGDPFDVEVRIRTDSGEVRWLRLQGIPETVDEEVVSFRGAAQDVTERKRFERALTGLHQASRDLIQAESKVEVSQRTVDATKEILGVDGVGVYLFDDDENALRPADGTAYIEEMVGELPTLGPRETSITWEAFISGETIRLDDVLESDDVNPTDTPLRSGIWIPLDDHGVLAIVSEDVGGFDPRAHQLADHLAATAEATLDRVEREESLHEKEHDLVAQNRRLENLNRMNDIIREIDQVLIQTVAKDAIEQEVCERLTQDDRFTFAWIGHVMDETVTPRTWAGAGQGYLDAVSLAIDADGGDPAVTTASTGEVTVVSNVATNLRSEPWRKAALSRDLHSAIAVPLQHGEMHYGVLTVYAAESGAFDQLSQEVLGELGETIGNAMNAVETKKALLTDSVVELELAIHEADDPLVRLATETGSQLEIQGIVPQPGSGAHVFVTANGVAAHTVQTAAEESTRIERVTRIDDADDGDDESRFEMAVTGPTVQSTLVESGAVARSVRITGTEARVVAELLPSTDVRALIDRVETIYPNTELVARRERDHGAWSGRAFKTGLTEDLTDRQLEVLQTAYLSGYFEWPRERTGEEVARSLDITQPTFNGHLRAAERKLCTMLFDGKTSASR